MRRPRKRALPLLLVPGLVALCAGSAWAEEPGTPVKGTSDPGYPRSDDVIPPGGEGDGGDGQPQDPEGESYDNNWILPAGWTANDVIVFRVADANIGGYGAESDGNGSADIGLGSAWAIDQKTFKAPGDAAYTTMHVRNVIEIHSTWHLMGNGRNAIDLLAVATDLHGQRHRVSVQVHTNVQESGTETSGGTASIHTENGGSGTANVKVGGGQDEGSAGAEVHASVDTDGDTSYATERTWAAGQDLDGYVDYYAYADMSRAGNSISASVQSCESACLTAQLLASASGSTLVQFPHLDTLNVLQASYVTVIPSNWADFPEPPEDGPDTGGGEHDPGPVSGEEPPPDTGGAPEDDPPVETPSGDDPPPPPAPGSDDGLDGGGPDTGGEESGSGPTTGGEDGTGDGESGEGPELSGPGDEDGPTTPGTEPAPSGGTPIGGGEGSGLPPTEPDEDGTRPGEDTNGGSSGSLDI